MRCDEVEDHIEGLAEGQGPGADVTAHLRGCDRCSAALQRARQIDRALAARPAPAVPDAFTLAVMRRVRPIRWESEQRFDWWFNIVMAVSAAVIGLGVWAAFNITGLATISTGVADSVRQSVPEVYQRVKPQLSLYGSAAALVFGTLAVWWWIERGGRRRQVA